MEYVLIGFSILLIVLSLLPFIQNQHWIFRVSEMIKFQLLILQLISFVLVLVFIPISTYVVFVQIVQLVLILYHLYIFIRFTKFWRTNDYNKSNRASQVIKIISCNVYQFNKDYKSFINLINENNPDVFITMESNKDWEIAMRELENDYPYQQKVTLENTYGMHLFTKLKVIALKTHFFVADDLPSIEATLESSDGFKFIVFGVHPPPPSPIEESNSKERDGDLLSVAKKVKDYKLPVLIIGDFNNVAWAKSSILFKKMSGLIDARIGRGIIATFHAKYWFFRLPLDLLFHSANVFIDKLYTLPNIGSDHFPVCCTFYIDKVNDEQEEEVKEINSEEIKEVNEMIEEGKNEVSDNRE